ncbi:phosphoadenosine phosphosulfate reductase family protein [Endobacter medicaginis]
MTACDPRTYDHVLVMCSGGKDSVAALLEVLERGVDPERIELWHHGVDGRGEPFMDWPSTRPYVDALGASLGLPVYHSWRDGGFLAEMLRDNAPTAPVRYETPYGERGAGGRGAKGTRLRFPQVSADLRVRWCSAALKIDVADRAICGQDQFLDRRTLVVTGERAEESPGRARYAAFEPHRTDTRAGTRRRRHVDHWRPVHAMTEAETWRALQRRRITPAIPYRLGFGRLSCMTCIFGGADEFATIRHIAPDWFGRLAAYESRFGCTIKRGIGLHALADRGSVFPTALARPDLVAVALSDQMITSVITEHWEMPDGAFRRGGGPV